MRAAKTKTEVRQEQIVKSAFKLIARHGFHNLSMAMLAEEVGIVPSALYRHYKSKEEVLDAVLELISQKLIGNVEAARRNSLSALDRLNAVLVGHAQLVQNDVPIPRVIFSEEIFTGNKKRRYRVHQIFKQYLQKVAELFQEGQRTGEIRSEFAPDTLSMMYLGLIQPAAILWLMSEGEFDLTEHVQNAWRIFRLLVQSESNHKNRAFRRNLRCAASVPNRTV